VDELIQQVRILSETLQTALSRMDQAIKLFSELSEKYRDLTDKTLILNEALTKSLNEADGQIDDLARINAASLRIQQFLQAQQEQEQ
jgi:hypothetical protein